MWYVQEHKMSIGRTEFKLNLPKDAMPLALSLLEHEPRFGKKFYVMYFRVYKDDKNVLRSFRAIRAGEYLDGGYRYVGNFLSDVDGSIYHVFMDDLHD